ncbi:peptidase, putative [Hepatocystis sp. ex Piliocolobus tephrosceles]|nr:peptidase, putative [Hepatocystis sp. ex Piliocolobus tephrosceles]
MKLMKVLGYVSAIGHCMHAILGRSDKKLNSFYFKSSFFFVEARSKASTMTHTTQVPQWVIDKRPNHSNYSIVDSRYNKNFDLSYTVYEHKKAKTQVIVLGSNDELDVNQMFSFYVKTLTNTNKGIPHILEHSVLSGSKKYDYKELFMVIDKGSLNTYLNASTYNDRTFYMAGSINNKDFFNILNVYMDCVFQPNVLHNKIIFQTEGWTYELEEVTDKKEESQNTIEESEHAESSSTNVTETSTNVTSTSSDDTFIKNYKVSIKGVVYSEMKGVFANPLYNLYYEYKKMLFPDNVHSKNSGGDPKDIPNLTFEEFKEFYYKNYNPKKIKLFFASNRNPMELLNVVDEYLSELDYSKYRDDSVEDVKLQRYKKGPFYVRKKFGNTEKENILSISWLLNPEKCENYDIDLSLSSPVDYYALLIINYLLSGTTESVLYKTLTQSGLGESVIDEGLDDGLVQYTYSIGLKGVKEKDNLSLDEMQKKFEDIVISALENVVKSGFNKIAIEAAINQIEYSLKEAQLKVMKSKNYISNIAEKLHYNKNPMIIFDFEKYLAVIKENLKNIPNYFETYIQKHFIDNKHRVIVLLEGDENYTLEEIKAEKQFIKNRIEKLSEEEKETIIDEYKQIQIYRNKEDTPEHLDEFPMISISDLNKKTLEIPVNVYFTNIDEDNNLQLYADLKLNKEKLDDNYNNFVKNYILKNETTNTFSKLHEIKRHTEGNNELMKKQIPMLIYEMPTMGIVYLQFLFKLDHFTLEELGYLSLFNTLLFENRTLKRSSEEFVLLKEKSIGSVSAGVLLLSLSDKLNVNNPYNATAYLDFELHVINHNIQEALDLSLEALKDADFSNSEKVIEILNRGINGFKSNLMSESHKVLLKYIRSNFDAKKYARDVIAGYRNYCNLQKQLELAKTDYSKIEKMLTTIRDKIFNSNNMIISIACDTDSLKNVFVDAKSNLQNLLSYFDTYKPGVDDWLSSNNVKDHSNYAKQPLEEELYNTTEIDTTILGGSFWNDEIIRKNLLKRDEGLKEFFTYSTTVNAVAMTGVLFEAGEYLNPAYVVVMLALRNSYLWSIIRVLNGAYIVNGKISYDGTVTYLSARDPNLEKTLQAFRDLPKGLRKIAESMTEKDLQRYIIKAIGLIDMPKRGLGLVKESMDRILTNETEQDRDDYRNQILNTKKEDFYKFAELLEKKAEQFEKNIVIFTNNVKAKHYIETVDDSFKVINIS